MTPYRILFLLLITLLTSACVGDSAGDDASFNTKNAPPDCGNYLSDEFDELETVPKISITTKFEQKIKSKTEYVQAAFSLEGNEVFQDCEDAKLSIRGRGNSTWNSPKKPYKIKFPDEQSIFGLAKAKKWILLGNFIDGSLMTDVLALKVGRLLDMPYTHHTIPVELYLNGEYQGVYIFTEHKEASEQRVDVGENGYLLELTKSKGREPSDDPGTKMHYFFESAVFDLPVLPRFPNLHKIGNEGKAREVQKTIQEDFADLEECLDNETYEVEETCDGVFDLTSLAQFLVVHQITRNSELNHPKSVYLHKTFAGPFSMGPIWDFDWAYGGSSKKEQFRTAHHNALLSGSASGALFFKRAIQSLAFQDAFKTEWQAFKDDHLYELKEYLGDYTELLSSTGAYARDYEKWHAQQDKKKDHARHTLMEDYLADVNSWLDERINYVDSSVVEMEQGGDFDF